MKYTTKILGKKHAFDTTQWAIVRAAPDPKALDSLIAIYWKPLYFFARQRGYDNETAKDITQSFLTALLVRNAFSKADPSRGRFRSFLLAALENFIKDWTRGETREKRGGGRPVFSLDFERGEGEFNLESARGDAPDRVLHRAWARTLWTQAFSELEADAPHLEAFRLYLKDASTATIAARTGLSESGAKSAVHRLKDQLRRRIVEHLRKTAGSEADLQADLQDFVELLAEEPLPGPGQGAGAQVQRPRPQKSA